MNRTKIEWTDFTWNPVVGCHHWADLCSVGESCYARKQAKRHRHRCQLCYEFWPHMHPERLEEPYRVRKPSKIFVCSMGDLFGEWVPKDWIKKVIKVTEDNPHHIFQFLTKRPDRYEEFDFPENCWLGTTINKQFEVYRIDDLFRGAKNNIRFISFEPLYEPVNLMGEFKVDWIIIGAQTNPYWPPKKEWVESLIEQAREGGTAVFLKDNLNWPEKIQEFPSNSHREV